MGRISTGRLTASIVRYRHPVASTTRQSPCQRLDTGPEGSLGAAQDRLVLVSCGATGSSGLSTCRTVSRAAGQERSRWGCSRGGTGGDGEVDEEANRDRHVEHGRIGYPDRVSEIKGPDGLSCPPGRQDHDLAGHIGPGLGGQTHTRA